jgi:hypothetical protein
MILNQAQADGIYGAMCTANNFGGRVNVNIGSHTETMVKLESRDDGSILIVGDSTSMFIPIRREFYANQAEFATAYGLQ